MSCFCEDVDDDKDDDGDDNDGKLHSLMWILFYSLGVGDVPVVWSYL